MMRAQRTPSGFAGGVPYEEVDNHAPGVEPKPYAQRLERALLRAPEQGQEPQPLGRGRPRQQLLFFGSEIIGGEGFAARLDDFEIAA